MTVDGNPYRRSGVLNSWEFLGHHWHEYRPVGTRLERENWEGIILTLCVIPLFLTIQFLVSAKNCWEGKMCANA
eukprot:scaffold8974_cov160-Chaetoceros_neogracile.AAC.1